MHWHPSGRAVPSAASSSRTAGPPFSTGARRPPSASARRRPAARAATTAAATRACGTRRWRPISWAAQVPSPSAAWSGIRVSQAIDCDQCERLRQDGGNGAARPASPLASRWQSDHLPAGEQNAGCGGVPQIAYYDCALPSLVSSPSMVARTAALLRWCAVPVAHAPSSR